MKKIRVYGLGGESVSLRVGFELSKAHARPSVSLHVYKDVLLSYGSQGMLPNMMIMD